MREKLREATWAAILDAAEQVAAEGGTASASLQPIAERAGIAVGTIYNYFHDKLELFDELFARRRAEMYEAIDEAAKKNAKQPFAAQLEAYVGAVFAFFDRRRAFLRIALEADASGPKIVKTKGGGKQPAMHQLQERAERVIKIGIKEGRLRRDDEELLAPVLVSIVRGVLTVRSQSDAPFAGETARVIALFLRGAAA